MVKKIEQGVLKVKHASTQLVVFACFLFTAVFYSYDVKRREIMK
jgi:hypothetical protein